MVQDKIESPAARTMDSQAESLSPSAQPDREQLKYENQQAPAGTYVDIATARNGEDLAQTLDVMAGRTPVVAVSLTSRDLVCPLTQVVWVFKISTSKKCRDVLYSSVEHNHILCFW